MRRTYKSPQKWWGFFFFFGLRIHKSGELILNCWLRHKYSLIATFFFLIMIIILVPLAFTHILPQVTYSLSRKTIVIKCVILAFFILNHILGAQNKWYDNGTHSFKTRLHSIYIYIYLKYLPMIVFSQALFYNKKNFYLTLVYLNFFFP